MDSRTKCSILAYFIWLEVYGCIAPQTFLLFQDDFESRATKSQPSKTTHLTWLSPPHQKASGSTHQKPPRHHIRSFSAHYSTASRRQNVLTSNPRRCSSHPASLKDATRSPVLTCHTSHPSASTLSEGLEENASKPTLRPAAVPCKLPTRL